jgi:hypothetical protein
MSNYPESFDNMLAAWNESDPQKIRQLLESALTDDVHFIDPSIDVTGIDGFERNVHDVQARLSGAVYSRISAVDTHHNLFRYHWAIHQNGALVLQGFDVVEARDNKVARVLGFFGDLPISSS